MNSLRPSKLIGRGRIIDWLIFNAGVAEVVALNWVTVFEQLVTDPILLFTLPRYLIERVGSKTDDGIGLVFQANVFGHYYMVHSPSTSPKRSSNAWSHC
jgi:3-keto steroid reductase